MNTEEFLAYLRTLGIYVRLEGDQLRYNAPEGALTADLRAQLVQRKPEILRLLGESLAAVLSQPSPTEPQSVQPFVAPCTPTEKSLAQIWNQVLNHDRLSVHDDFFGLGGDSVLAVRAISLVRQAFEIEISLRDLFESPTIAQLAEKLDAIAQSGQKPSALPLRVAPQEERLLANLKTLSDQEVYTLLADMLAEDKPTDFMEKS